MIEIPFQFEYLPNEILIEIFQYFDARDLFKAFNNLNSRFNELIRSLNNLSITFSTSDLNEINDSHIYSHYIHIIILSRGANIYLNNFTNIRRLKFLNPTYKQLDILNSLILPYLEYLYLGYEYDCGHFLDRSHKRDFCDKVFSNCFPNLISCYLLYTHRLYMLSCESQLIQLRILRVERITLRVYQIILLACPNLYFFRFIFPSSDENPLTMKSHLTLRRMIIQYDDFAYPLNDYDIDVYLSCVPNLKQLCIYRDNEDTNITPYLSYNWLAEYINRHLSSLHRFKYHFRIYLAEKLIKNDSENILKRLEENFKHLHNNQYQSKLVFKLFPWSIVD